MWTHSVFETHPDTTELLAQSPYALRLHSGPIPAGSICFGTAGYRKRENFATGGEGRKVIITACNFCNIGIPNRLRGTIGEMYLRRKPMRRETGNGVSAWDYTKRVRAFGALDFE